MTIADILSPKPIDLAPIQSYLRALDMHSFKVRAKEYESQSRKFGKPQQIRRELYKVLMPEKGNSFVLHMSSQAFPVGIKLYRGRLLHSPESIRQQSDVWEPPAGLGGPGRLNRAGEPLLYTSLDPLTAAFETRVKPGDIFSMAEFESKRSFDATYIGKVGHVEGLNLSEMKKLNMVQQFLEDAFTRRVSPDDSHGYAAPELIVKDLYDLPPEVMKAWSYRSLANPSESGWNICFRPGSARNLLTLTRVDVCRCREYIDGDTALSFDYVDILRPLPGSTTLFMRGGLPQEAPNPSS